jgi:hypothetical protein
VARSALREVVYRIAAPAGTKPTQLSLILSLAAPTATIETTATHLDDEGDVWRTLSVRGDPDAIAKCRAAFATYAGPHLVEKEVLGATARRFIAWYKYRPELVRGTSHTRLAFRLLGRDTVITDRARGGELEIQVLGRGGAKLQEFLREVKKASKELGFRLLYLGPPRDGRFVRLTPAEEETLRLASSLGYYAVPRRAGVREVAERGGLSASAAGYRLRQAERKLVAGFLE